MVVLERMDVWTLQAMASRPCLAPERLPRQSPLCQAIQLGQDLIFVVETMAGVEYLPKIQTHTHTHGGIGL